MAQFDVYRLVDGGLVLDCQNDLFDEIGTRFVVPLVPPAESAPSNAYLNPTFRLDGEELSMVTQFATAVRTRELRTRVGSLAAQRDQIVRAIDVLVGAG